MDQDNVSFEHLEQIDQNNVKIVDVQRLIRVKSGNKVKYYHQNAVAELLESSTFKARAAGSGTLCKNVIIEHF